MGQIKTSETAKMDWWPNGKLRCLEDTPDYYMFREDGSPLQFYHEDKVREDDIIIMWEGAHVEEAVNATEARAAATYEYMVMLQSYHGLRPHALRADEAARVMTQLLEISE